MMHTSMLRQEELRIFEELISRFDSLSEAEMSAVGVTPEWSAKDLLAHLTYWERAAVEHVREFEAGKWRPKKRTRAQMERINREVVSANRATPRHLLREELILARSEIVAAMKRAPEELEERSPLARIVYSQCVRHRGHHLGQLQAWIARIRPVSVGDKPDPPPSSVSPYVKKFLQTSHVLTAYRSATVPRNREYWARVESHPRLQIFKGLHSGRDGVGVEGLHHI